MHAVTACGVAFVAFVFQLPCGLSYSGQKWTKTQKTDTSEECAHRDRIRRSCGISLIYSDLFRIILPGAGSLVLRGFGRKYKEENNKYFSFNGRFPKMALFGKMSRNLVDSRPVRCQICRFSGSRVFRNRFLDVTRAS
jgi:hypothetical protein